MCAGKTRDYDQGRRWSARALGAAISFNVFLFAAFLASWHGAPSALSVVLSVGFILSLIAAPVFALIAFVRERWNRVLAAALLILFHGLFNLAFPFTLLLFR